MTSTEIAIRQPTDTDSWVAMLPPVGELAQAVHQTEFVPGPLRGRPPAVIAAVMAGREIGLQPMQSLQHIHIIDGRPTLSAQMQRSLALAAGYQIRVVETNTTRCIVEGRRSNADEWTRVTWTLDDAKKAGLLGRQNWQRHPRRMLQARSTAELCQLIFSDAVAGMACTEEAEDGAEGPAPELGVQPASNGHAEPTKPAGRTAQRRTRASADRPTTAAPAAATAPTTAPATAQTAQDPALPPLPGEDEDPTPGPQQATGSSPSASATGDEERDYDSPGTVTTPQLTATWTVLKNVFGFTAEEKDQARAVAAYIVGHPLASSRDMSHNEARAVLDTLGNWQATAKERGETPRGLLIAYMAAAAGQDASGEPEPGDG